MPAVSEPDEIAKRITATLERIPARLNHASLLEEMLQAFRQDGGVDEVEIVDGPNADAVGPSEEEAGGVDD